MGKIKEYYHDAIEAQSREDVDDTEYRHAEWLKEQAYEQHPNNPKNQNLWQRLLRKLQTLKFQSFFTTTNF